MTCKNLSTEARCRIGLHGGTPSAGVCALCESYDGPMRGLGDAIDAATSLLRIKQIVGDCGGCAQRRAALNEALPFPDSTEEET
jgi:hypothetical protein